MISFSAAVKPVSRTQKKAPMTKITTMTTAVKTVNSRLDGQFTFLSSILTSCRNRLIFFINAIDIPFPKENYLNLFCFPVQGMSPTSKTILF
jgi:hypothetical protein